MVVIDNKTPTTPIIKPAIKLKKIETSPPIKRIKERIPKSRLVIFLFFKLRGGEFLKSSLLIVEIYSWTFFKFSSTLGSSLYLASKSLFFSFKSVRFLLINSLVPFIFLTSLIVLVKLSISSFLISSLINVSLCFLNNLLFSSSKEKTWLLNLSLTSFFVITSIISFCSGRPFN